MPEYSGYKIKRTHALAPFASVYEAEAADGRPGRFALKVFHPPASTEVRRFYALEGWLLAAERQQQAAKKDGTVVEVLASGRCEEGAFAVMPWQERSLEPWIKTLGHKGDTLRALAECLLNTLEKWEAQTGGPHGNLKPANVFLNRSGSLVGMTAQLSDPGFMPGEKVEQRRLADLAALGAMLATIVRRRPPGAWPIEEAPEWKALGHGGKGWLDFCNYLLNPTPAEGEVTLAEARRRLRKVPKDSNPAKTAALTGAGVLVAVTLSVLGFARFGDPIYMPDRIQDLAVTLRNPKAFRQEITPQWAQLCRAWDTWLIDLQNNAKRLDRTAELWAPNDPLKVAIANFVATAQQLRPETLVPEAAGKGLGTLANSPPDAVRNELLKVTVSNKVVEAWGQISNLSSQMERWPRWEEMRRLLALIEGRGFSRAAGALQPKLPPVVGVGGAKFDPARTMKLFNDVSLDDAGTLPLANRWGEITRLKTEMEANGARGDRIQQAMPAIITGRLTDKSSLADFADSLTPPLEEMRLRRKQFNDPQVVRERFLKESELLVRETAAVTEADFPRWEQELFQFSKVPAAEDPRRVATLDDFQRRLPTSAADLEDTAPAAEPDGLPTLSAADFKKEFDGATASLTELRNRPIVRHDLPKIGDETAKMAGAFQLLEQRVAATLVLLNPQNWLDKIATAAASYKYTETKQRWAAWLATLSGVTADALKADRPRLRQLRANERQLKEWINGLEGPTGLAALTVPDLGKASPETSGELLRLETLRREQAATAAGAAAEWRNALPVTPWATAAANVRAPLDAHAKWLGELPEIAAGIDRLGALLLAGFGWHEGVSDIVERLARFGGAGDLAGRPNEWHTEAKLLQPLVDSVDRAGLKEAAKVGGLSRKLTAWRRLGAVADWPAGAEEFDQDGAMVATLREIVGRDVADAPRRGSLFDEMAKETRRRFNRGARLAASVEAQLNAMFDRMTPAGIAEENLEEPVAYNHALWQLKKRDRNETNLEQLRVWRDTFVSKVRAINGVAAQPAVSGLVETLSGIELKDDPNRPKTPSPGLAGWTEEATDEGLGLTATWTKGAKTVRIEYSIVQPTDGTQPFYLAKRAVAVGEFVDLLNARNKEAEAVRQVLPRWVRNEPGDTPYNKPVGWKPRDDGNGFEVNSSWFKTLDASVDGLRTNGDLLTATPELKRVFEETPTPRSPVQHLPPEAARVFAEKVLGARLPKPEEWRAVVAKYGKPAEGFFRGSGYQKLGSFLANYKEGGVPVVWRPTVSAFLPLVKTPGSAQPKPYVDDGQVSSLPDKGRLWFAPVDEGPALDGFVNLFGNVWVYLLDSEKKQYYVAGGSVLSPPGVDIVEPQKVEGSGLIGSSRTTTPKDAYSDVGIRPAFDAPPGFKERFKFFKLVREQKYLTL
ncbi:MAG: hypothetical protein HYX71_01755 [Opitutae bacterium]|nr:hypothetical protein [Opitutae bacterium]